MTTRYVEQDINVDDMESSIPYTIAPIEIIAFADPCQDGYGAVVYPKMKSWNGEFFV